PRYSLSLHDALPICGTEGQILVSGVMSDEYFDSETFPTRIEYDSRAIDERNGTLNGVFFNLQKARVALEGAVGALQQYAPTPNSDRKSTRLNSSHVS